METKTGMATDMDKFKRRLIRTVARLLIKEKLPEEEVFLEMQKETKCNCKLLWKRMRLLTIKKLQRLLNADDKSENIANVGRMSLTDWLLFDLVIVHEDIDVIGKEQIMETRKDPKPLLDLFVLVQRFNIEVQSADSLAEKWTAATIHYNSMGHQCSPMLMQRRWYQLKEFTRDLFYDYWFTYRGVDKHLTEALKYEPTKLQRAIAKRFPKLIVEPFMKWEEMIKNDLVIMPDVFEHKMRQTNLPAPMEENSSDIVIVEPEVETIDLDDDSDTDKQLDGVDETSHKEKLDEAPVVCQNVDDVEAIKIKTEKVDEDSDQYCLTTEENILERERKVLASIENAEYALDHENLNIAVINTEATVSEKNVETITEVISENNSSTIGSKSNEGHDENVTNTQNKQNDVTLPQITSVAGNVDMSSISDPEVETTGIQDIKSEVIDIEDDIIMMPTENIINEKSDINNSLNMDNITEYLKNAYDTVVSVKSKPILNIQCKKAIERSIQELKCSFEGNTEVNDLEMEIAKKANEFINKRVSKDIQDTNCNDKEKEIAKNADIYINFRTEKNVEDDIIMTDLDFVDDGIEFIDDGIVLEDNKTSTNEDNDVPQHGVKEEIISNDSGENDMENADTGKFDLKLLMDPVVYTLKLDDMQVLKNNFFQSVKSYQLINKIDVASKIISPKSTLINMKEEKCIEDDKEIYDDIFSHDFDENSEELQISDDKKVKMTSYLLNKPKVRDYNFIQLCKNPDFNTRLKRINVGFFSSTRNRELLKACKPITIDVSKAFENKMIKGILYLKDNSTAQHVVPLKCSDNYVPDNFNIMTSTIASHSLLGGLVANMANTEPNLTVERSTVINLPNINEIRRINQKLLTAEVTPIQISTDCNKDTIVRNDADRIFNIDTGFANISAEMAKKLSINAQKPRELVKKTSEEPQESKEVNTSIKITKYRAESSEVSQDLTKTMNIEETSVLETNENSSKQENHQNSETKNQEPLNINPIKPKKQKRINRGPVVSWLQRPHNVTIKKEDILLTMDSLRKMIHVMEGESSVIRDIASPPHTPFLNENVPTTSETKGSDGSMVSSEQTTSRSTDVKNKVKKVAIRGNQATRGKRGRKLAHLKAPDKNNTVECLITDDRETTDAEVSTELNSNIQSLTPNLQINNKGSRIQNNSNNNISSVCITSEDNLNSSIDHTHSTLDVVISDDIDIAANETCDMSAESTPLLSVNNSSTQSLISDTVNHLIIEPRDISTSLTCTSDASTTTSVPEIVRPNQTIHTDPTFTALYTPKSCNKREKIIQGNSPYQMPIVNSTQSHIILDASNSYTTQSPQQTFNMNDNIIPPYIFNKIISESALRLSKDKILLSSITFPKLNIPQELTTPLPPGVQLVLPPNGELSFFLDPGVVLDDFQLAQVLAVIEAVKLQLQSKPPPISAQPLQILNDVVDLTDEDVSQTETQPIVEIVDDETPQTDNVLKDNSHNTDSVVNVSSESTHQSFESNESIDKSFPKMYTNKKGTCLEKSKKSSSEITGNERSEANTSIVLSNEPTIPQERDDANSTVTEQDSVHSALDNEQNAVHNKIVGQSIELDKSISINKRKSILSDLMEISGIGEEDISPVVEEPPPPPQVQKEQTSSIVIQLENGNKLNVAPVTSFKELKYACENNALFYELNCITGIMQKVNVCLSKAIKPKSVVNNKLVPSVREELVKLPHLLPLEMVPDNKASVSPLVKTGRGKGRRAINTPPILSHFKIHKLKGLSSKTNPAKPNLKLIRKCLLKSKVKLYEKHQLPITLDITNADSDSSDDEPLIKKAKRMREGKEKTVDNQRNDEITDLDREDSNRIEQPVEYVELMDDVCPTDLENEGTANEEANESIGRENQPEDEDLPVDEEYLDENFIVDEEMEDGGECILGV